MSKLTRAIYIIGGVLIVASAVKVIWSGLQYVLKYLQNDEQE